MPAASRHRTTLRRKTQSKRIAATNTGICHRCVNERANGIAEPAIAPMTAVRRAKERLDRRIGSNPVEMWSAGQYEEERRGEHDQRREQSPANSIGDVAHAATVWTTGPASVVQGHGA